MGSRRVGLVFGTLVFIFLVGMFGAALNVPIAQASGTIYIRADGSIDPPTAPISTVDNITYIFADNINDSIVVERDSIVIDGAGYTVKGTGASGSKGIDLSGRSNVTIKNMIIRYFWKGICLEHSSNNTISENKVANDSFGIYLSESNNNSLSRNNITANNDGFIVEFSFNNVLRNNNMFDNEYNFGVHGYDLNDVDASNTVDGKPIYYWVNEADRAVPMDAGCVVLVNSTHITVRNLNLTRNLQGIQLAFTTNSTIAENSIANNYDGIRLDYSSNNSISGNNITNSSDGIYLVESSNDNTILGNNITANVRYGIMVYGYSNNNSISGNNVANSFDGIYLGGPGGSNNSVSENNITANVRCGIRLYYLSSNNIISGNHITNNQNGIGLEGSSGNMFYHNNFINNIVSSSDSVNVWDDGYPSGGNYWSNYTGDDLDYDGIGDSWHEIDADNIDHYPLMGMFSSFNTSYAYSIDFVANSSVSNFSFNLSNTEAYPPEAILAFNVSGEAGTEGFLRVCIPKILINGSYVIMSDGEIITNTTWPQVRELPCSDETYAYFYINYTHSEHKIEISGTTMVPEFPSFLFLPLFMAATLPVVIAYRRKRSKSYRE